MQGLPLPPKKPANQSRLQIETRRNYRQRIRCYFKRHCELTWHKSEHREYNETGKYARRTIYNRHEDCIAANKLKNCAIFFVFNLRWTRSAVTIPFDIVAEIVVTGHVDDATPTFSVKLELMFCAFLWIHCAQHLPGPSEKNIWTAASAQT